MRMGRVHDTGRLRGQNGNSGRVWADGLYRVDGRAALRCVPPSKATCKLPRGFRTSSKMVAAFVSRED